jgi:hypothetical protein
MSSPLTTAGDIWIYSTSNSRLPIGTNGQVLVARSSATTGLAWETQSGGGDASMIYLSGSTTTTTSATSLTVSNIPQTASDLFVIAQCVSTASDTIQISFNSSTATGHVAYIQNNNSTIQQGGFSSLLGYVSSTRANDLSVAIIKINSYTNATNRKSVVVPVMSGSTKGVGRTYTRNVLLPAVTGAITAIKFDVTSQIGTNGYIYIDIWGAKRS